MRRRVLIGSIGGMLAAWLAAGALFCESSLRVQRRPAQATSAAALLDNVQTIAVDGVVLRGSFVPAGASAQDCVLLLHGVADSRASALGFANMFVSAGYSVLAVDSRGHGTSGGELVTYGLLERTDVLRWAAWLRRRGCRRIYGLGESMGGAILIQAAAEEPVFAAIAVESAFRDLRTIAEERIVQHLPGPKMVRRTAAKLIVASGLLYARIRHGFDLQAVSPVESAARMKTPALLIHGLNDTNTPPAHSQAIAANGPCIVLWLVPGAQHIAAASHAPAEFKSRVLGWFELNGTLATNK